MTTLTIHQEEDEQRQLKVTIEVAEERVQKAMRQKARQLGREIRVPGFRPGKAPYNVIVRRVGKETLRLETVEDMIDDIFIEALAEVEVQPYAQPTMDNIDLEPLRLEFTIPMEPQIDLGDYREIRLDRPPVEITDEAVEDSLDHVRTHHEIIEPVDRPVEIGDLVTYSGTGESINAEGEEHIFLNEERDEMIMDPEILFPGTPFVENIVGLEAGDQNEFNFTFPDDYEDEELAGREANFDITVLDVQTRELPALDDELAKLEGDYETLDDLRADLRERLEKQAEDQARQDFFESMMDAIWDEAEIVYPPAALEAELDEMVESLREQVTRIGWEWEDYLRLQGQAEEELREEWLERAENRLERNLILVHFLREEKIALEEELIEAALEERMALYEDEEFRQEMRNYWLGEQGYPTLTSDILMDLIIERMQAIAAGTAPDLAELEAAAAERAAAALETAAEEELMADDLADRAETDDDEWWLAENMDRDGREPELAEAPLDEASLDEEEASLDEEEAALDEEEAALDEAALNEGSSNAEAVAAAIFEMDESEEVAEPATVKESEE